jgi:hypothetical protein
LVLHDDYSRTGSNPRLTAFARKVVDVVQSHIDMLRQMGACGFDIPMDVAAARPPSR